MWLQQVMQMSLTNILFLRSHWQVQQEVAGTLLQLLQLQGPGSQSV
jgi:hypothetical protein